MLKITQAMVEEEVAEFKRIALSLCNGKSLAFCIATARDTTLLEGILAYQEILLPKIKAHGLTAPSLSEIFGTQIDIKCKDSE